MAEGFNANPTYDEADELMRQAGILRGEATRVFNIVGHYLGLGWPSTQYRAKLTQLRRDIVVFIQSIDGLIQDARQNRDAAHANHPRPRVYNKNLAFQRHRLHQLGMDTSLIARQMEQLRIDQARYVELQGLLRGRARPQEGEEALLAERATIMRTIYGTGSTRQGTQVRASVDYSSRMAYITEALTLYKMFDELHRLHEKLFLPQAGGAGGAATATNVNKPTTLRF